MERRLNILIACEESQAETIAFRQLGHNAFSCDLQPARRGTNKAWHIIGDVTPMLQGQTEFQTEDGSFNSVPGWDLIIAHPPCTYLSKVGSPWLVVNGRLKWPRFRNMILARRFFFTCLNASARYVAVENPIPMKRAKLPRPSFYIQPYWFGVKYSKKTLFWVKNLPPILPEIINPEFKEFVHASRGKYRSRTFPQVAAAIAKQWSEFILDDMEINQ